MASKILLADDSPTIQKVIKITFANEPYDILECSNEKELYKIIKSTTVDLVLLDFNLSDENSGYDMAKKIKDLRPNSKILMMFGTFDTIDENALKSCGISGKVVKPFESSKFIGLCNSLLDDGHSLPEEKELEMEKDEQEEIEDDSSNLIIKFEKDDDWVVNSSGAKSFGAKEEDDLDEDQNGEKTQSMFIEDFRANGQLGGSDLEKDFSTSQLEEEDILKSQIRDWGMVIPPKLNTSKSKLEDDFLEIPPILEGQQMEIGAGPISPQKEKGKMFEQTLSFERPELSLSYDEKIQVDESESKLPDEKDLEYPDVLQISSQNNINNNKNVSSKFIALDDLKIEEEESFLAEETDPNFNISFNIEESRPSRNIEEQIAEEVSSDKFWEEDDISAKIDTSSIDFHLGEGRPQKVISEANDLISNKVEDIHKKMNDKKSNKGVKVEELVNELIHQFASGILETMRPVIEDNIKKHCQQTIEKIAWEILPDLAENMIKKELGEISESVIKEKKSS